jgi:plasmid maintenance system antidote protein VapI
MIDYHQIRLKMPMKNPPHPGDLIRTEILAPLGLSVSKASEILKVRRATSQICSTARPRSAPKWPCA